MKKIILAISFAVTTLSSVSSQITSSSFATNFQIPTGTNPTAVQVYDIDGDGKKDIITNNLIFRNIYTGGAFNTTSFAPGFSYPGGGVQLVIADMDGDGVKDIVGNGFITRNLSTPGNLSFAAPVPHGSGIDFDVADMDGDGLLDIVIPVQSPYLFRCLRNTSTPGNISFAIAYDKVLSSAGFQGPYSIKCSDFNLDGKQDVIIGCHDQGMCILYNQSTPGFLNFPGANYSSPPGVINTGVADFAIGDLNFDTYPDVIYDFQQRYTTPEGDYLVLMSNVYNASWGMIIPSNTSVSNSAGTYTYGGFGCHVDDLDLDGKPDIMENSFGSIRVWRNVYTGVGGNITYATNFYPADGNGLSFSSGGVNNTGDDTGLEIASGDLTGDGMPEIVSVNYNSGSLCVLKSLIDSTKNITTGPIASSLCIGGAVSIPFTVTGHFYGSNNFTAQLSDATGSFASPVNIGTLTSTFISGTISGTIPGGTPVGTGYRIRVISSSPAFTGANNGTDINITNSIPTSISIAVSPSNTICQGTSVTFTPTITGGGTPTYQWRVNGSVVSSGATYTTSSLLNGDNVTCTLISSLSCASPNPILSNTITMNVTTSPLAQPSSMTGPTNACAFTSTTYSVPAVAGATSYTWTLPGGWTGTSTTNSITCTTGATGGNVSCVAVNSCTTSVARTTAVTVTFPPTTSNAGPDQTICATSTVLAANTPASGAGQWTIASGGGTFVSNTNPNTTINNPNVGVNKYVWTITTTCAVSRDTVQIIRNASPTTSNAGPDQSVCGTSATLAGNSPATGTGLWTVVSGTGTFANASLFNSGVTGLSNGPNVFQWTISSGTCPSSSDQVQITSSPIPVVVTNNDTTICPGNSVTLNATGASSYTWSPATNLNTTIGPTVISTPTLTRTYTVTGTTGSCSGQDIVVVTLGTVTAPTISISASATTICAGQTVNFTSTPTNQGITPTYQWKINGVNVGTNSSTFSSNTLLNGDVVTCQMISNKPCVSPTTVTSNSVNITVNPSVTPNINITATGPVNICASQNITFTSSITSGGTTPIYQWQVNGVNVGTNSSSYSSTTWNNNDVVRCILTSNASCATTTLDTSNFITVTVSTPITASVSISSSGSSICSGQNVSFFAAPVNGGASPSYQWQVNGVNAGTNSPVFNTTTLTNGNVVTCQLFSSAGCASPSPATSNAIFMTVTNSVTPTISINASSTTICAGTNVNFNATISGGGSTPSYQWQVNGNNVGTNSSSYSSSGLNNGDVVTCILTSNATCATPSSVTSNSVIITVNNNGAPSISIATVNNPSCAGAMMSFTSTVINGGATPSYNWKVNGISVGVNTAGYNTSGLNNGDIVTCVVTSSNACAFPTTATSNSISAIIQPTVVPSIAIMASQNPICAGGNVTFTTSISNGGASPSYQWKINGVNVGSNNPSFTSGTLNNSDIVTCQLTSTAACAAPVTVISNSIVMNVNPNINPTISINASSNNICNGTNVTFNASITGGGTSPSYQWQVNGINVGVNSSAYASSSLNNGDVVTCILNSNAVCATPSAVTSNAVTMIVNTGAAPIISISAINNPTCAGGTISFSSNVTNGGATPLYNWKVNGVSVGVTTSTFNAATLNNGDVVTCIVTSSLSCASPATATSNSIAVVIQPAIVPTISINTSQNPICSGQNVSFSATISNGGTSPVYQWKVNGSNVGSNSPSFTSASLNNNDIVTCELTSNATCASPATVVSNAVVMTVNNYVTPTVSITANDTTICMGQTVVFNASITNGGSSPVFQWEINGVNAGTNSSTFSTAGLNNGDIVTCSLTSNATCPNPVTTTSNAISVDVGSGVTPSISISVNSNPVCSGTTMIFSSSILNGGVSPTYTWMVNGSSIGASGSGFSSALLQDGDIVTCILNSSDACAFPNNITSNAITVSVNSIVPSIAIAASDTNICSGQNVVFTSSINNGGSGPGYQWQLNGTNIPGANSSTYNSSTLNDNDVITCILTSNATCASPTNVTSNPIGITVLIQNPSITIGTTDSIACAGENLSFTATASNLGTGTFYQWMVNGVNAGTNSIFFNSSGLNDNDVITCSVSTNNGCGIGSDLSNAINITVNTNPSVSITANDTTPCFGDNLNLTGSGASSYYWTVDGSSTSVYSASATTITHFILIGTDVDGCTDTANISISILPLPTVIASNDTSICPNNSVQLNATGGVGYLWTPSTGLNNSGIANPMATLNTSINYSVQVTGANGCVQTEDVLITVIPCLGVEEEEVNIRIYPNPFNEYFTIDGINEKTLVKLHNAIGEVIGNWIISSNNDIIETGHLRSGMYFLSFEINGKTITKKIIRK